ncbi:acyl-CoA dehydrogenase family protein [Acetobacterium malicum]|uniref:acyl-CoA dehydrogenase family protein n=1 Tax=Acetobacterium malicum TaxID=52692 RepID=UPI0004084A97|nr:acyl-CoA dehydrogenase family protein [Acetobacterium dehalogenans]
MDFLLTEVQMELMEMVKDFGEKEIDPIALEYDHKGEFPIKIYKKAFEMGLHTLEYPEKFGGSGVNAVTATVVNEELGKHDAGFATSVSAVGLAAKPVLIAGTDNQKKLFADLTIHGAFAAFCLTEPNAGSDAGSVKTTAKKVGNEYILNGRKCFITNGGVSNVYTVIATTDSSKGVKGLSAFLVERDREGVSVGKEEDKMGIRLSNTTDVIFEDVRIPETHLLGNEGDGFKIAMVTLDYSRPNVAACSVGICQAAIDHCVKYAKERTTFGKPIATLQAIQFMLADMEISTETARQYTRYAASLVDAKKPVSKAAAIAKCFAGDAAMKVSTDAVQILAGYGYSREYPVEKLMRDAKIFQIFEGTNQIQRLVIAGQMLR